MVAAGATRVGASAGVKIVQQARGGVVDTARAIGLLTGAFWDHPHDEPHSTSVRCGAHGGRGRRRPGDGAGPGMDDSSPSAAGA